MIGSRLSALVLPGLLAAGPVFADTASGERELAVKVKAVFKAKCTQCHGPQVRKPRGKFGYVLDLKKLAADAEKVVPKKPDDSALWQLVRDDEMPPEDARAGPLTQEQKQIIHDWIAAGAPAAPDESARPAPSLGAAEPAPAPRGTKHFLGWLGKFHVIAVHFPIALLLAAAAGEVAAAWRRVHHPAPAVRFCVLLGAISALVAAILGWLHAASGYGMDSPSTLAWHRGLGTATAGASVVLVLLSEIDERRGVRSRWFRLLLLLVAVLVAVAGYFGGRLAYGDDFFTW